MGQSIGAGRPDMAKRFAYSTAALGFLLVSCTGCLLYFFSPVLAGTLTPDPEVIAQSVRLLRIVAFAEPMFAVSIVIMGALRGAGDSKGPFLLNLCSMWGIRILTIRLFTRRFGLLGIWGTMTVELFFRGSIFVIRMLRGRWIQTEALK